MSRSRKKHNIGGVTTAASEKDDKKQWHKVFRQKNRILLNTVPETGETVFVTEKETSDPWKMSKDGKTIKSSDNEKRK